jgi:NADH:ubiquinone oxidoreductase subunit 4 (subunit M)
MLGETNTVTESFKDVMIWEKLTLVIIVLLIFGFGLFPNIIIDLIEPGVNALLSK